MLAGTLRKQNHSLTRVAICRKTAKWGKKAGSISGCDFSGIVEEIGPDVAPGLRSVGERVASMVHGGM